MQVKMKPMQVLGRPVLAFLHDGDGRDPAVAAATLHAEMQGSSRANILRHWTQMPDFIRKDQAFQCLMDYYHPMTEEEHDIKQAINRELVHSHLRDAFGARTAERFAGPGVRTPYGLVEDPSEEEVIRAIRSIPLHRACVDYCAPFGGSTALSTSNTPQTVIGAKPRANQSNYMWGFSIGFDGTTSTSGPAIIELHQNTWASSGPGVNSTSVTVYPTDNGRPETIQTAIGKHWTTEPVALTLWENFFIPSYMGSGIVFQPLTKPFILTSVIGGSMRVTQQASVTANGTGSIKLQE